jgi:hypothetical protein
VRGKSYLSQNKNLTEKIPGHSPLKKNKPKIACLTAGVEIDSIIKMINGKRILKQIV